MTKIKWGNYPWTRELDYLHDTDGKPMVAIGGAIYPMSEAQEIAEEIIRLSMARAARSVVK